MKVGLFIPCYVDQLFPDVGLATLEVLEQHDVDVDFPTQQTCCGQPMANTGCTDQARPLAEKFLDVFSPYEYVVAPSGSCVAMIRHHYDEYLNGKAGFEELKKKTFELCEFLVDVLQIEKVGGSFPYTVGFHKSCHGLRELRMGSSSERVEADFDKPGRLLSMIEGLKLAELKRNDECCGFGGTFAVSEEAVSCMMGMDRLQDHQDAGVQIVTAADMSCLMHLEGLARRYSKPLRIMHIAQILAGRDLEP